ncbi:MAG: hypothetical protein M0Z95_21390 [Actinomycetota bacterium]|nr:hypothetical protein [Actinomycetota bacterium]
MGHFEGDLITGAYNRSAIVTVFDRTSRYLWLADFPEDHGAEATLAALCEILERIPEHSSAAGSPGTRDARWPARKSSPSCAASTSTSVLTSAVLSRMPR